MLILTPCVACVLKCSGCGTDQDSGDPDSEHNRMTNLSLHPRKYLNYLRTPEHELDISEI